MDIGIDLGTTFSVIAVHGQVQLAGSYPPGIYLEDCGVTIIPTPYGEQTYPSVMVEDPVNPGRYLFGSDAVQKSEEGLAPVMFSKRKIGTQELIPQPSRPLMAREVAREFLRYMKGSAEQALGRSVTRAVVTHPAYFDRGAVEETREAAREAGFDMSLPEQMLMEPVAAALAYTRTDPRDPLRVLTYDLGGGTLDVTFLVRREGVIEMRAFDGDHLLGGYNFDREIAHWIRQSLETPERKIVLNENDPVDRGRLARLLRLAERVKIDLANARTDEAPVDVRGRDILVDTVGRPVQINLRLSRKQFVGLIRRYLDLAAGCCSRALEKAGVTPAEVDEVLLVGGSTYAPWVAESLKPLFPDRAPKLFNPDLCVGAGAAIHAQMVLPALVSGAEYKLTVEAPPQSALDVVAIAGRVANVTSKPLPASLQVILQTSTGRTLDPASLNEDGRFLFEGVELAADGPSAFELTVVDEKGTPLVGHSFSVTYAPQAAEMSGVTTVLPKPLYIQTADGLVPLAREGVPLPARCVQSFTHLNDNPTMTMRLYQERDPIGEVRVQGIPPEGGRGCSVDLAVEVTERNQIRGTATVRTPAGKVVMRVPVLVQLDIPDVSSAEALRRNFGELKRQFEERVVPAKGTNPWVHARAGSQIRSIDRLFNLQPLERQEVERALRQLEATIKPPEDDMKPPLAEFISALARCREALQTMTEQAREAVVKAGTGEADAVSRSLAEGAARALKKATYCQQMLDKLEPQALQAHKAKDRPAWTRLFEDLMGVDAQLRQRSKVGTVPTNVQKLLALREADKLVRLLNPRVQDLEAEGRIDDWRPEVERIRQGLRAALKAIEGIDDALPPDQGLAKVRLLFQRTIAPLAQAIERLGIDVGAAPGRAR